MAALWMSRYGIKTRVIDKRNENMRAGQADGIQCRSLEIFDSFDVVDQIWKESCHMAEVRDQLRLPCGTDIDLIYVSFRCPCG